jgi:mannose-6-phosphate isomerase-like protein (cupin superfamily)
LLGVVLHGVVTTAPSEGASLAALKPWSAFVAPGVGLTITADASGGAVLLVAYPLDGSLDQSLAALRKSEKAVFWDKRPGTFVVDDIERITPQSWAKGAAHAWIGFEKDRSPQAYLGLLLMDESVGTHAHDTWEVLVPIRGKGSLTLSPPGKDPMQVAVQPGEVLLIPPGTQQTHGPSGDALLAVQLFVPPGPEQHYRAPRDAVSGDP